MSKLKNMIEIEHIAKLIPGTPKNVYSGEKGTILKEVLVLKGSNVDQQGRISTKDMESVFPAEGKNIDRYKLQKGDVVVMARGTAIRVGMVTEEVADKEVIATANFIIIRPDKKKIWGEVIFAYFNSKIGQEELRALSTGAVIQHIPVSSLKKLKIPIPSFEKQKKICDVLIAGRETRLAAEVLIAQQKRTVDATILGMMA